MYIYQRHLVLNLELVCNFELFLQYFEGFLFPAVVVQYVFLMIVEINNELSPLWCGNLDRCSKLWDQSINLFDACIKVSNFLVQNYLELDHHVEVFLF
jgi:hypothetical protein